MFPIDFIAYAFIVACFVAFIITVASKIGLRDKIVSVAPKLISELVGCDFCLSFWLSLLTALILTIFVSSTAMLLVPFVSAVLARLLI